MSYLDKKIPLDDPATVSIFDETMLWSAFFGKILLDHVPLRRHMRLLDLACGAGFPLFELAHRLDSGSSLTGVDNWEAAIARAQWKKEQYGLQNVELLHCDAVKLPFPEKEFDLIVSNLGINNFQSPVQVLKECYRVLKRPGRICLTTNTEGHFMELYTVFEATLRELGLEDCLPKLKAQEQHRGTDESIRAQVEDARFSVVKLVRDKFYMRFVSGTALLNHFLTVVGFLDGWRSVLPPDKETAVFSLLEKKLNEQADWDGELRMTVPVLYLEAVK